MNLKNHVAIVTGAASGIGKGIAYAYADNGVRVVAADVNREGVEEVVETIHENGGDAFALTIDVSQPDQVQRMVNQTLDTYGHIDILCYSAGIDHPVKPLVEMDVDVWDRVMNVNVKGIFLCAKAVLPSMIKAESGTIINVASDLGYVVVPNLGPYCTSKGAVLQLTRALAAENGPYGIRVNAICPTMVDTPMARRTLNSQPNPEAWLEEIESSIPLRRIGTVDEIASVAVFLASDEASYITGACMTVDGGRTVL